MRAAHRTSYLFSFAYSMAAAAVLWFTAPWLARLFTQDPLIVQVIVLYLRVVPVTLVGFGVVVVAAGGLNAIGQPLLGLGVYAVRTVVLYVPLAFAAAQIGAPLAVFVAIALANVLSGAAVWWWSLRHLRL